MDDLLPRLKALQRLPCNLYARYDFPALIPDSVAAFEILDIAASLHDRVFMLVPSLIVISSRTLKLNDYN